MSFKGNYLELDYTENHRRDYRKPSKCVIGQQTELTMTCFEVSAASGRRSSTVICNRRKRVSHIRGLEETAMTGNYYASPGSLG